VEDAHFLAQAVLAFVDRLARRGTGGGRVHFGQREWSNRWRRGRENGEVGNMSNLATMAGAETGAPFNGNCGGSHVRLRSNLFVN
jgi:hypothetical protein